MKLNDYQNEAVALAIYPGVLSYPALGLCGEMGELFEAIRSVHNRENVIKEIGDCLWYIANVANDADLTLSKVCDNDVGFTCLDRHAYWTIEEAKTKLGVSVGAVAEAVKKTIRDNHGALKRKKRKLIKHALYDTMSVLRCFAEEFDTTLEECAKANLEKLKSRRDRGKIQGDGDNR